MPTISQFPVSTPGTSYLEVPAGATLISAMEKDGGVVVLYCGDMDAPDVPRMVEVVGTGWYYGPDCHWVATVPVGGYVWHVMDVYDN